MLPVQHITSFANRVWVRRAPENRFIVKSIGNAAIKQGFVVFYRSIFDIVRDFLHDDAFEGQVNVLGRYLKPDLLIVDDMGMRSLPKRSGETLP